MRKFFNSKLLRERVLMLVFLGIGVLWWGPALIGRIRQNVQTWGSVAEERRIQQEWLGQSASIKERTTQVARKLEKAKTMNAAQAYAEVDRLAGGLPHDMGGQRTDPTESFSVHSLQVTFRRTDMASLVEFYKGVLARAPYLGIEQFTINAERANPGQVNAVFRIYSVEVP